MEVYFDNAASTPLDDRVLEAMLPYMKGYYGNPSSTHSHGRAARVVIEESRKKIASILGASTSEIYFTSGGTESDNIALHSMAKMEGVERVISSKMEHHAVLNTVQSLGLEVEYIDNDADGVLDYDQLARLLSDGKKSVISIMHVNNETGNLNDIEKITELCKEVGALFHSDTVQTLGTKSFDLNEGGPDAIAGSAHKFYGPKGVGLLYLRKGIKPTPVLHGGSHEKGLRPGTENTAGIVGMAKALELAQSELEERNAHYRALKSMMWELLQKEIPGVDVNGAMRAQDQPNVLNVLFPETPLSQMLTFNLDLEKISASGGSACGSGALKGSHVLAQLNPEETRPSIRFSFGKQNTMEEVEYTVSKITSIFNK